ncbi:MAG: M24 family metallopeptidase [Epsilonproteobacteria bacterium]|nr:M24 family metallopeptidase [Campylobacterota bacterium]
MNYIIFKNESALYYEVGYSCDNGIFLALGDEKFFITDGRYEIEAKKSIKDAKVVIARDILKEAIDILKKSSIKKLVIDPKEWDILSFNRVKDKLKVEFKFMPDFSHKKRIIKSSEEIELIKKAVKIGKKSFKKMAKELETLIGAREWELNFWAESIFRGFGKREVSFMPILAINENAAKPHATPTKKRLKDKSLILLDGGVKYKRYCSDRTRTAFLDGSIDFGLKQKFPSKKMQKAYDLVLKAHDRAIKKARSGMRGKDIDKIAREVIEKGGFGKYFVHSTGHGVGLDIHEMPYISSKSKDIIEDGMVFTIEPGIYIEGEFGIRIEDMVVMKDSRAEVL